MDNIHLFVVTTLVYCVIYFIARGWWRSLVHNVKACAIIALLCLPINIGGNVFTVFGNVHAEKDAYSVASLYQRADTGNADALVFSGYQRASGHTIVLVGLFWLSESWIRCHGTLWFFWPSAC